jgi:hypothetical protein
LERDKEMQQIQELMATLQKGHDALRALPELPL